MYVYIHTHIKSSSAKVPGSSICKSDLRFFLLLGWAYGETGTLPGRAVTNHFCFCEQLLQDWVRVHGLSLDGYTIQY